MTTTDTMLDQIDALDGSTDWSDANVYARILGEDGADPADDIPEGTAQPVIPAAVIDPPAGTDDTGLPNGQEVAGVLTRDGKHVIPFPVLEAARAKAAQVEGLEEKVALLTQQLAERGQAAPTADNPDGLTPEELADLADIPQIGKLNATVNKLTARLEALQARGMPPAPQAGALTPEQIEQDQFDAAIAANPLIAKWLGESSKGPSPEWVRAGQIDALLKDDPATAALSYTQRFEKVQRMVAAEFGVPVPPRPTPAAAAPAAPTRRAPAFIDAPDPSLDELGAVSPSVQSDRWAAMSVRDMSAATDSLSDDQLYRFAGVNA